MTSGIEAQITSIKARSATTATPQPGDTGRAALDLLLERLDHHPPEETT